MLMHSATITSTAVVDALNAAYEKSLSGAEVTPAEEPAQEAPAAPEVPAANGDAAAPAVPANEPAE